MKRKLILTVAVLTVAVLAGLLLAYFDGAGRPQQANNSAQSVAVPENRADSVLPVSESAAAPSPSAASSDAALAQSKSEPVSGGYLLGEYNGWLAVFPSGGGAPSMIYDVLVRALPRYDQELLAGGIYAADEDQLALLLEDYLS